MRGDIILIFFVCFLIGKALVEWALRTFWITFKFYIIRIYKVLQMKNLQYKS